MTNVPSPLVQNEPPHALPAARLSRRTARSDLSRAARLALPTTARAATGCAQTYIRTAEGERYRAVTLTLVLLNANAATAHRRHGIPNADTVCGHYAKTTWLLFLLHFLRFAHSPHTTPAPATHPPHRLALTGMLTRSSLFTGGLCACTWTPLVGQAGRRHLSARHKTFVAARILYFMGQYDWRLPSNTTERDNPPLGETKHAAHAHFCTRLAPARLCRSLACPTTDRRLGVACGTPACPIPALPPLPLGTSFSSDVLASRPSTAPSWLSLLLPRTGVPHATDAHALLPPPYRTGSRWHGTCRT